MMIRIFFSLVFWLLHVGSSAQVNFNWAKGIIGLGGSANSRAMIIDEASNIYTTGDFQGRFDFNPGSDTFYISSNGSSDIYISKLDSSGNFLWAKKIGSTGFDESYSLASDGAGNIYITGSYTGTVDFNADTGTYSLTSAGSEDIFIAKYSQAGNFIWAKTMGGSSMDRGYSVHTDATGSVYTTGVFRGSTDFDPSGSNFSLTSSGLDDIFVTKHNTNGNFIWAKQLGGKGNETGYGITTDAARKVYVTGFFSDTADFNPGSGTTNLVSSGGKDIFVTKLDTAGNLIWAKSMGGPGDDQANAIVIDPANYIYTTGEFMHGADFDPNTGMFNMIAVGSRDLFISKLDIAGNFIWAKDIAQGGTLSTSSKSIAIDTAGNIYTTGWFWSSVDFDPSSASFYLSSAGLTDLFISKLDKLGNFIWALSIGANDFEYANDLAISHLGNIYYTGDFDNTVDFDPSSNVFNLIGPTSDDVFVSKLWNCVTAPVIITPSKNTNICPKDTVVLTASHAASYLWSTGATTKSIKVSTTDTFKVTATNSTGCPAYTSITVKVHQDTTIVDKYICYGKSFLFNGQQLTTAGVYRDTLPNFVGCDSLVILNLYIKNVDTTHVYDTLCDNMPKIFNNQNLTVAGLYRDTLFKLNGCDSHIFYHFIPKPSYRTPISRAICLGDSSLFAGKYYKISGVYHDSLKSIQNCDSIVTLTLTVRTVDTSYVYDTFCGNIPKTFNGSSLTIAGFYRDTLKNIVGCDSHIFYHFIPKPVYETPISRAICASDSTLFGVKNYNLAGVYYDTLKTIRGCDSVLKLTLTINTLDTNKQMQTICRGKSYNFYSQVLMSAGTYSHKFTNRNGCDSLILMTISVIDSSTYSFSRMLCSGQSFSFNNQNLTQAGVYRDTFLNHLGCDSFVTLNLSFGLVLYDTLRQTVCAGQLFRTYTSPGTYYETYKSSLGCDSILTIYLKHTTPTNYITINHTKCGVFTYGTRTFTQIDSFTEIIKNNLGCDSIMTKHLVFITEPQPKFLADKTIEFCEEIMHKGQLKTTSFYTQDTVKSAEFPYCDSLYQPYYYRREKRPILSSLTKQIDTVIKGETTSIQVSGALNYLWTTGEQSSSIRPQINEDKIFEVTAWNLADCEEKMRFNIYAIDQPLIDFPTAFSPNGDGLNDYFTPNLNGNITIEYLQVFNRWGEKVYEYSPNTLGWDGFYLGNPAANGLYTYTLRYSYLGRVFTKSGEVIVVR
jgi:gliding motility-associated-like protein